MKTSTRRRTAGRWWLCFGLATSMVIALGAAPASANSGDVTASVLYFDNHTGDPAWDAVGRGMADMVTSDLSGVPGLKMVERTRLNDVIKELALQQTAFFDPKTAQKLGKGVGAKYVITGALTAVEPTVRIDIRLIAVKTGDVELTDSVVGSKERFFELEAQLVSRFAKALKVVVAPSTSKVSKLASVQALGVALKAADAGDQKSATSALSKVVSQEPDWKLGKKRYLQLLKQVHTAKDRRTDALRAVDKKLWARVAARADGKDISALGKDQASAALSYRVLATNLMVRQLRTALDDGKGQHRVTDKNRGTALKLIGDYMAQVEQLVAGLVVWRSTFAAPYHELTFELDDADSETCDRAGYGSSCGEWTFATPAWVSWSLAKFLLEGKSDLFAELRVEMTPTPAQLDPTLRAKGYALLAASLAEVDGPMPADEREQMGAYVLDTWADALVAEGKAIEGVARLQMILDRYPKHKDYAEYEQKLKAMLNSAVE